MHVADGGTGLVLSPQALELVLAFSSGPQTDDDARAAAEATEMTASGIQLSEERRRCSALPIQARMCPGQSEGMQVGILLFVSYTTQRSRPLPQDSPCPSHGRWTTRPGSSLLWAGAIQAPRASSPFFVLFFCCGDAAAISAVDLAAAVEEALELGPLAGLSDGGPRRRKTPVTKVMISMRSDRATMITYQRVIAEFC